MLQKKSMCMHMCFYACKSICRDQKRELDSLELELQVVASHQAWVLGTGPGSSARGYVLLTDE